MVVFNQDRTINRDAYSPMFSIEMFKLSSNDILIQMMDTKEIAARKLVEIALYEMMSFECPEEIKF